SSLVESFGSASLPRPLMACRYAACSIAPLLGNRNRNTSVRITIHSFVFTAGSQTCACWRSRKLNRFRPLRFRIRSSSVSSEQSGGSTLIGYFLERRGLGAQAARLQNVLQLASSPSFARRLDPRATRRR